MKTFRLILSIPFLFLLQPCSAQNAICGDGSNLVSNPDFDLGNSGFSTTLCYGVNCNTSCCFVGPSMQSKCYLWPSNFVDHTSGTGNLLAVDGDPYYAPQDVWMENIQVYQNRTYVFSFWAKNLYTQQPFGLGVMIAGSQVAMTPNLSAVSWNLYSTTWTAPSTGLVTFGIRQTTPDHYRDFALDDIFVGCIGVTGSQDTPNNDVGVNLFPNPCTGDLNITGLTFPVRMDLLNAVGEKLENRSLESGTVHFDQLPGIYFLRLETVGGLIFQKLVITDH